MTERFFFKYKFVFKEGGGGGCLMSMHTSVAECWSYKLHTPSSDFRLTLPARRWVCLTSIIVV